MPSASLTPSDFVGSWEGNDPPPESSHLTMAIVARADGNYDLTIHDDHAAVCAAAPSTMTGLAEPGDQSSIVIAQPDFTCDDGSDAHSLSGPPLPEQLKNLTFTYNPKKDRLTDSGGLVWNRVAVGP